MFRSAAVMAFVLVFVVSAFAQIKPATRDEIQQTIKTIDRFIDAGKEKIIEIYSYAIEIEKRATTPYLADVIAKKIMVSSKIPERELDTLRNDHSFSEIVIAWAVSQFSKIPLGKVFEEIEKSDVEQVLEKYACDYEYICSKILELRPGSKARD